MSTNQPPQRKRKVGEVTPTAGEVTPTAAEEGKTYYVLEEGKYVPVKKVGGGSYVSPPACESDEDVDPVLETEYYRQIRESGGFDLNMSIPNGSMLPFKCSDDDRDEIAICAKLGLHWYNFQRGSNFQLLRLEKYNSILTGLCTYYITADAMDPASDSRFVFQTCVTRCSCMTFEDFRIETEVCRIKPETQDAEDEGDCQWNYEAIDDFYKGDLKWLPDDALVQSKDKHQQYYEVQDSDIRENDWLSLYAEYAFFPLWENSLTKLKFGVPLEITNVVVQTHEAMESKDKLKAGNAIFYISFRDRAQTEDHRAVIILCCLVFQCHLLNNK
ncbi:hypothetical protein EUTSA_v10025678mg [Eutrema salsugineum]|uniref:Cystatin domain-containing protein n=1 Tax=Eutrema salsugineum TaxID=72664 RepID=V4LUG3_EUTSA|nr:hypothetical protein EUTSA_v10025678mg [Eutrema salsugineum]